nr:hypothetical protein [Tanacetum cinerariifolium]
MAGGGSRKDDATAISSSNVFAALGSLKKKKKDSKKGGSSKKGVEEKEPVFWAPSPLNAKSWADVDDEDDDDYYATTAPPVAVWGAGGGGEEEEEKAKGFETPVEVRTIGTCHFCYLFGLLHLRRLHSWLGITLDASSGFVTLGYKLEQYGSLEFSYMRAC